MIGADAAKKLVWTAFLVVAPDLAMRLLSIRSRRLIERQSAALGLDRLARSAASATGGRVAQGPFSGMILDYEAFPCHSAPKFLGTYECELWEAIEQAIAERPPVIVNVGTAEGFYAVGLALRVPEAQVVGFDADPKAARATRRNAERNNVSSRVDARGIFHPGDFQALFPQGKGLLVMDCEGAEFDLLRPDRDPVLETLHLIVELHGDKGEASDLLSTFQATHGCSVITSRPRSLEDAPNGLLGEADLRAAIDERRIPGQQWLVCRPKDRRRSDVDDPASTTADAQPLHP